MPSSKQPKMIFSGRWHYKIRSIGVFIVSLYIVTIKRSFRGPLLQGWGWQFEISNDFLKRQTMIGFKMNGIGSSREYEDSLFFSTYDPEQILITEQIVPVKGAFYEPKDPNNSKDRILLYLHGGGYAYYSASHQSLISAVCLASKAKTFVLDYRLTPEHPFPAQLEDALEAYKWLLAYEAKGKDIIIAGDSAGGNLVLTLLQKIRDLDLTQPNVAIGICPWTDVTARGGSLIKNSKFDWVSWEMPIKWGEWYCGDESASSPLISPVNSNLLGMAPIYLQAGDAEILFDMIKEFEKEGKRQNANISLDVWKNMTHDFQAYGATLPEAVEALNRIGEVVDRYCIG